MTFIPADPRFAIQWYLDNTGQLGLTPGIDIDVTSIWPDYTGAGVLIGVVDDGVELSHSDLAGNISAALSFDAALNQPGGGPTAADQIHGTAVAGLIAGVSGNGLGGVGVAFDATLAAFRILLSGEGSNPSPIVDDLGPQRAFERQLQAGVDVSNNSWGPDLAFSSNWGPSGRTADIAFGQAVVNFATQGRDGLGSVVVVAAGNDRANGSDANLINFSNSRHIIAVAAIDGTGTLSSYSTPGASLLVSAPGGPLGQSDVDPGQALFTTDRSGTTGYNHESSPNGDFDFGFDGTSGSAALVSGVVALMLEANPGLGYRDVQEILAYSARQVDVANASWAFNGAENWNGGGLHFSRDYGFGLIDARAAVRLAESWPMAAHTAANELLTGTTVAATTPIPDGTQQALIVSLDVGSSLRIDKIELDLTLTAPQAGELAAILVSPSGTSSVLFARPNATLIDPNTAGPWPAVFTLTSNAFWGETGDGTWELRLIDFIAGNPATFNSATLRLYGDANSGNDVYVYTDDFATIDGATPVRLEDGVGVNVLDGAALTGDSYLSLAPGSTSMLAGRTLTLGTGTAVQGAIGGDGEDLAVGTDDTNRLVGGHGLDTLVGRGGADILEGGADNDLLLGDVGGVGNDTLDGGSGDDTLLGFAGDDLLLGGDGDDLLIGEAGADAFDGGAGNDRIVFDSADLAVQGGAGTGDVLVIAGGAIPGPIHIALGQALNQNQSGSGPTIQGFEVVDASAASEAVFVEGTAFGADGCTLIGSAFADSLSGGTAADLLVGGAGNDTLVAGGGNDTLIGGSDADQFQCLGSGGELRVADFLPGTDVIGLAAASGLTPATALAAVSDAGEDALLAVPDGPTIRLVGIDPAALSEASFLIV